MGSNKRHKNEKTRDIKKKRHRSRSRSYSPEREKNDKHSSSSNSRHHKKHKRKERRDYDSDVEIVSAPPPPKISKTSHDPTPPPPEISTKQRSQSPIQKNNNNSQASLSIEETNRLRAKLGLKPLETNTNTSKDEPNKLKDDLGEFYHKPAINNLDVQRTEKLKEKLNLTKEKRKIETSLSKIKPLGDNDSDDDTVTWIEKNRKIVDVKKQAEERAKILDQLDEEFGINELVNDDVKLQRKTDYTERNLHGLKIEHNIENFDEGKTIILTLKDKNILDDDDADVLLNVNMKDDERYKKNVLIKSKKPGYDAYDEDNYDEFGFSKGTVLDKYDEEINGEKNDTFIIGIDNAKDIAEKRKNIVQLKMANKKLETLKLPELKLASDYYNNEEIEKFKKTKKKKIRKIRQTKPLKADDLLSKVDNDNDYLHDIGSRRKRTNDLNNSKNIDTNNTDDKNDDKNVPSVIEQEKFRRSLENAASMVFHSRTGLPLTSSPAPLRRGHYCFDYDSSLNTVSSKRSALFELNTPPSPGAVSLEETDREVENIFDVGDDDDTLKKRLLSSRYIRPQNHALLGNFEESALNGRLEPVSTVHGFTAEIGASGSFCPKHRKLPVTVFFYTLGDNDKVSTPYLAHINLEKKGYQVPRSGTIQVTLLNPLGTVVKMFVVLYDLSDMPPRSHTFLRQRTLRDKTLRYLIHLRFMSGKSGRIYLHTDIRIIICRKSDVDTASDFGLEPQKELRSYIHGPTNPKFSPRC